MKRVLKYPAPKPWPDAPALTFSAPVDFTVVHVGPDGHDGDLCVWATFDDSKPTRLWLLRTVGTGWDIPEDSWVAGAYVNREDNLVWHVVVIPS